MSGNIVILFEVNMKYLFFLILSSTSILSQTSTGIVRGKVIDVAGDSMCVVGANVVLLYTKLDAATDIKGNYEIKNIPLGKYIIKCGYVGSPSEKDTIEITEENTEIKKDFYLFNPIPVSMPDSIKEYHSLFSSYKPDEILNIFIDSLSQDFRKVYLTFTNKIKYPIYLIEDMTCFNDVTIIMKNEDGEIIKRNTLSPCDIRPLTLPGRKNLIKLEPFASIQFPPFYMQTYDINSRFIPKGKYYISVKYEIKDYKYLPGIYHSDEFDFEKAYKETIEVLNQATRGTYYSENVLEIEK